ncbi:MAG: transcription antitermination factor NusB [Candidatus Hydrogenedentes bacterium]|nr:transcription antitermination factor NusB [Candidatus Hydrogenedentota bacterium]
MSAINPQLRRRARERAVQFLFGLDFTQYGWESTIETFWVGNPVKPGAKAYAERLIRGVMEHRIALDEAIDAALNRWTPDRVGRVERNVLRVALYEMWHEPDVPTNVAINEAIEVTKVYGEEETARFINGVLDRLREIEPRASAT